MRERERRRQRDDAYNSIEGDLYLSGGRQRRGEEDSESKQVDVIGVFSA